MTQAWDAARAASKRSIRKYKPVAPIAMPVERLETGAGYRIDNKKVSYTEWVLDTKCGDCGFNVCCCDTNRKFERVGKTGFRTLKVGDVLVGKGYKGDGSAHGDQVLIVAELDVAMGDEKGGRLGIRAYADCDDKTKLSTWRYGYLREEFEATDFGGCRKHSTLWDLSNADIPHECTWCKGEAEDAPRVPPVEIRVYSDQRVMGIDHRDMDAMKGFAPPCGISGINSVARGNSLGQFPVDKCFECFQLNGMHGVNCGTGMRAAKERREAISLRKQITATPEQAKLLEVPYQATIPIGRNYRFPVEKNPISDFKDFGNHTLEPMEQWSLEQLKTRMDEIMDQVVKHMTNGPHK